MQKLVSIVTGSSRGIGLHIAKSLSCLHGHTVVITGSNKEKLENSLKDIHQLGGEAAAICVDLSQPTCSSTVELFIDRESDKIVEKCKDPSLEIFNFAMRNFKRVDRLVCNAGVIGPIQNISQWNHEQATDLNQVFQVNLISVMQLCHYCLPELRKSPDGGRILLVSSGAATRAIDGWSAYCTSKAALNHFGMCLDLEERKQEKPVGILSIRPGVVDTQMQEQIRTVGNVESMKDYKNFVNLHENKELESPEKIGEILACLVDRFPMEWSGQFKSYNNEEVTQLISSFRIEKKL
ncbi:predicted protein [Naegleria gruberi]|uniref:Predicted protein n=1 Tax=Naegleria gruberi TaxID=5762 RepID=D2VUA9_NAEGR|nr:uncharacterized protein NAEGRDRAFT_72596 [Naegleria gruberi]EFC39658.1 predicted protein [Naegleria gruberi]|eukprot:XP_002672402.1 predicted protein [Naegleria gruberi strain NEG-M]